MSDDEGALVLLPATSSNHSSGLGRTVGPDEASQSQGEESDLFPGTHSNSQQQDVKKGSLIFLYSSAAMAALGGLLFGYDMGIISAALPHVKQAFSLSCAEEEAVVSLMLVGGLFASLVGGIHKKEIFFYFIVMNEYFYHPVLTI